MFPRFRLISQKDFQSFFLLFFDFFIVQTQNTKQEIQNNTKHCKYFLAESQTFERQVTGSTVMIIYEARSNSFVAQHSTSSGGNCYSDFVQRLYNLREHLKFGNSFLCLTSSKLKTSAVALQHLKSHSDHHQNLTQSYNLFYKADNHLQLYLRYLIGTIILSCY